MLKCQTNMNFNVQFTELTLSPHLRNFKWKGFKANGCQSCTACALEENSPDHSLKMQFHHTANFSGLRTMTTLLSRLQHS